MGEGEGSQHPSGGFFLYVMPALLYVGAVFYMGVQPMPRLPELPAIGADKWLHGATFFGMQLVVQRAVKYELPRLRVAVVGVAATGGALLAGGALELVQAGVPGRSAEWADFLADGVGALLGWLAAHCYAGWGERRQPEGNPAER